MRSLMYRAARLLGDLNAISRGPRAIVMRLIRKAAWRTVGGWMNKFLG